MSQTGIDPVWELNPSAEILNRIFLCVHGEHSGSTGTSKNVALTVHDHPLLGCPAVGPQGHSRVSYELTSVRPAEQEVPKKIGLLPGVTKGCVMEF